MWGRKLILAVVVGWFAAPAIAQVPAAPALAGQYRATLQREAQFMFGMDAPIAVFAAQIHQESSWRAGVTAWDNGRGLAQFMDATADVIVKNYPELGAPDPYNPRWAIRALVRYDMWLLERVQGYTPCHKWGAALKSYNGGLTYVQRAQKRSPEPNIWFGLTEFIKTGQSDKNFEYSRTYPHKVLFKHQHIYASWGPMVCDGKLP